MSFLAPGRLWLVLVPLALLAAYIVLQRRREEYAVRFTNIELLDKVAPERPDWRRHVPAAALLLALAVLAVATARPFTEVEVAQETSTIILAIDTSISMEATDVDPDRLRAAQDAARSFLDQVPEGMQVGVVGFSGTVRVMSEPSDDLTAAEVAIGRLELDLGTAIGEAIFASLDVIAGLEALEANGDDTSQDAPDADADSPPPATILLLSDGTTTVGRPDAAAAAAAVERGIPVSTIAFGTDAGSIEFQGEVIPVPVNAPALQAVADATGGDFFDADTSDDLQSVFEGLGSEIGRETVQQEVTDRFAIAGLLLGALAALGSLLWFSRIP